MSSIATPDDRPPALLRPEPNKCRCLFPGCSKTYQTTSSRNRHWKYDHSSIARSFFCPYPHCRKTFARAEYRDNHIRNLTCLLRAKGPAYPFETMTESSSGMHALVRSSGGVLTSAQQAQIEAPAFVRDNYRAQDQNAFGSWRLAASETVTSDDDASVPFWPVGTDATSQTSWHDPSASFAGGTKPPSSYTATPEYQYLDTDISLMGMGTMGGQNPSQDLGILPPIAEIGDETASQQYPAQLYSQTHNYPRRPAHNYSQDWSWVYSLEPFEQLSLWRLLQHMQTQPHDSAGLTKKHVFAVGLSPPIRNELSAVLSDIFMRSEPG